MPEEATRIVVLGTPKADKEFDVFAVDRDAAQKEIDKDAKSLERLVRDLRRTAASSRRKGGR